jgi:hypothetical protein
MNANATANATREGGAKSARETAFARAREKAGRQRINAFPDSLVLNSSPVL